MQADARGAPARPARPARGGGSRAPARGARARARGDDLRHRREDVAPRPSGARRLPVRLRARDGRRARGHRRARAGLPLRRLRRRAAPCRAGRPQICRARRWVLGGFAQELGAPPRPRCTRSRPGSTRRPRPWPSRSPPPCTRSDARRPGRARAGRGPRRRADGADARRAAAARGLRGHRGRAPRGTARAGSAPRRAGRRDARTPPRRLRGGRPARGVARRGRVRRARRHGSAGRRLPRQAATSRCPRCRCTTTSSTCAGPSTTPRPRSIARWRCWRRGDVDWRALAGPTIGLDELPRALAARAAARRRSSSWTRASSARARVAARAVLQILHDPSRVADHVALQQRRRGHAAGR